MHHLTFFAKRQRGEYKSRPVSVPYFTHHIKPQSRTHSALDAVAQTGSKAQRLNDLPTIEAHAAGVCDAVSGTSVFIRESLSEAPCIDGWIDR